MAEMAVHCIKTFFRGDVILKVDERIIARLRIDPSGSTPVRTPGLASTPSRSAAKTLFPEASA
jgi:hypothetical protein